MDLYSIYNDVLRQNKCPFFFSPWGGALVPGATPLNPPLAGKPAAPEDLFITRDKGEE